MKKSFLLATCLLGVAVLINPVHAEINVITTDTTLADIARRVGGDKVRVESLSRGTDDPHQVEPRPSMIVKLARAQVFARIGMDIDKWADSVLERAGNTQILRGGKGYADCSLNLKVMEIPPAKLDPSMGDIHIYGNPHYLLDPANGILAAGNIAAALIRVDPGNQPYYHQRFQEFGKEIVQRLKRWNAMLAPYKGTEVTVYHRTWVYFMARFGLKEYGTIEPKPGIPPSPGHINELVRRMKQDRIRLVLCENFRSRRFPDLICQQTGAKAVYVPTAVEGEPGIDSYFRLFDTIVGRIADALEKS
ncbi:MAG TPA: metal ABC transporter substrate-binding protein [Chthonomonadales bacterium]|nr:metal ABC transporter substrate-binding protein [Chthonomonadales bacterium]